MACIGGEPGSDVRSNTPMLSLGKPIERQVSFEPVEIRCRGINARARRRATRCRVECRHPGVAEKIQKMPAFCFSGDPAPQWPMIQE